jgi:hypothetical protein
MVHCPTSRAQLSEIVKLFSYSKYWACKMVALSVFLGDFASYDSKSFIA